MSELPEGRKPLGLDWFGKWLRPSKEKQKEQPFSEYGNYGENNPPLGDTNDYQ